MTTKQLHKLHPLSLKRIKYREALWSKDKQQIQHATSQLQFAVEQKQAKRRDMILLVLWRAFVMIALFTGALACIPLGILLFADGGVLGFAGGYLIGIYGMALFALLIFLTIDGWCDGSN